MPQDGGQQCVLAAEVVQQASLAVVRHMADRIVVLYRGRVMEAGPAGAVSARPLHPYTQALRAAAPVADVAEQRRRRAERQHLVRPAGSLAAAGPDACPYAARCAFAAPVCVSRRPRQVAVGPVQLACHRYDPDSGYSLPGDAATAAGDDREGVA